MRSHICTHTQSLFFTDIEKTDKGKIKEKKQETDIDRQTDTDRHRQTQTDTDRHRQTQTDTDRMAEGQTDGRTNGQIDKHIL